MRTLALALAASAALGVIGYWGLGAISLAKPPATERPATAQSTTVTEARFKRLPDGRAFEQFYPRAAIERRISGRVVVRCGVDAAGKLVDCVVVSEEPKGWGFGEATLLISREFKVLPRTADGVPTAGGSITFPVAWRMSDDPPQANPIRLFLVSAGGTILSQDPAQIWAAQPTDEDMAAAAPADGGRTVLACGVNADGELKNCVVWFQSSPEAAEAARRVARLHFRVKRDFANGRTSDGGTVIFPVFFPTPAPPQ